MTSSGQTEKLAGGGTASLFSIWLYESTQMHAHSHFPRQAAQYSSSFECQFSNTLKNELPGMSDLRHEQVRLLVYFQDLTPNQEERLGELTTNSKMCMDTLNDYKKLGEKILKTAELCRKLETEKEKVLPFYQSEEQNLDE